MSNFNSAVAGKRLLVGSIEFAFVAACALFIAAVSPSLALAYVDPSVMTYTIQALAGVAVAVSAVAGVALRRLRRALFKVFKIDENVGKEVEPDVKRIDPTDEAAHKEADEVSVARAREFDPNVLKPLRWRTRFVYGLLVGALFSFTVCVVAPVEIVYANSEDLFFNLAAVGGSLALYAVIITLVIALVLSAFKGRAFEVAAGIVVAISACCWIQAMFMNTKLPQADGSEFTLMKYKKITLLSSVVWIGAIVFSIVAAIKKPRQFRMGAIAVSAALIFIQAVGFGSLFVQTANAETSVEKTVCTEQGLYDLSSEKNVVVFVLDTIDITFLEEAEEEYPDLLDEYTGFTSYTNCTAAFIPTRYAVPYLLTGSNIEDDETFQEYVDSRYERSDFLEQIADEGYSIGIYSDSIRNGMDTIADETENLHSVDPEVDGLSSTLVLYKASMFREGPWLLKPLFRFTTEELNQKSLKAQLENDLAATPYTMDDLKYYNQLLTYGLSVNDETGSFRFIHLMGAHSPYIFDANIEESDDADAISQTVASLRIVEEYIKQMKELGVYDQSTIIVTADHGYWYHLEDQTTLHTADNPIFLYKPATEEGGSDDPCVDNNAPISHLDYPATILESIGLDGSEYGTSIFDWSEGDERVRYYDVVNTSNSVDTRLQQWEIDGQNTDWDTWSATGKTWEADEE